MCVRWSRSVSGWLISAQNILRRSRFPLVDLYNEVWIGVCSFCFHVGICCATLMMSLMVEFGFQLNKKGDLGSYFLCKMCGIKVWCYQFYSFWYLCDWQMRWKKEERCFFLRVPHQWRLIRTYLYSFEGPAPAVSLVHRLNERIHSLQLNSLVSYL